MQNVEASIRAAAHIAVPLMCKRHGLVVTKTRRVVEEGNVGVGFVLHPGWQIDFLFHLPWCLVEQTLYQPSTLVKEKIANFGNMAFMSGQENGWFLPWYTPWSFHSVVVLFSQSWQ